jgi:hypothetical protein
LIQKIKDAYSTVNALGAAFRNARILEDYRDSRIDELKWIIRVNELIQRRKDEQRELREKERDDARAAKESERAFIKAQREIIAYQAEIDALTQQYKEVQESERQALLEKLRDYEEKIKEKEVIRARSKSMAELGSTIGTVYIISNRGSFGENVFKIGVTRRPEPDERIHELFNASIPFPYDIHAKIASEDAPALERELHNRFALQRLNKVNTFKEFFNLSCTEIKEVIDSMGIAVEWTITAQAQQYEESMKITKQLEEGTLSKEEYLKKWQKNIKQYDNDEIDRYTIDESS